jgi:hypothetical protein
VGVRNTISWPVSSPVLDWQLILTSKQLKLMEPNDIISDILSVLAIGISIYSLRVVEKAKTKQEKNNNHLDFILEIDKMLIEEPRLWSIYESHEINRPPYIDPDDKLFKAKKDGFLYYILNCLEMVHIEQTEAKNEEDLKVWEHWDLYFLKLALDSKRMVELMKESIADMHYTKSFTTYLACSVKQIEAQKSSSKPKSLLALQKSIKTALLDA